MGFVHHLVKVFVNLPRNANKEQTILKCDNLETEQFARDSFHPDFDPVGHGIYSLKSSGN